MHKIQRPQLVLITLSLLMVILSSDQAFAATGSLRDVPQGHWAHNSVKTLVQDYGFMQGDPNGNFGGSRALSRYEFAKTMNNMLEYLKKQMETDHKDLENLVSVMEMFQTEIKTLETKLASANAEVAKQNTTVNELNEIVVALGDEYNTLKAGSAAAPNGSINAPAPESFEYRLTQVEEKVDSLKNRGLVVDTLLRGTLNDVRNVALGTGKLFKSAGSSVKEKFDNDESATKADGVVQIPEVNVTEEVRADVSPSKPASLAPTAPANSDADFYGDEDGDEDNEDEDDLGDIDGYYD